MPLKKKEKDIYLELMENDMASIRATRGLIVHIFNVLLEKEHLTFQDLGQEDIESLRKISGIAKRQDELRAQLKVLSEVQDE